MVVNSISGSSGGGGGGGSISGSGSSCSGSSSGSSGGGGGSISSGGSSSLFKFTEKYNRNQETGNKAHTQAPRMYTPKHFEPQKVIELN